MDDLNPKRKVKTGTVVILVILLVLVGIFASYFRGDASVLGNCEKSEDCVRANVLYLKGEGYVCVNSEISSEPSIKTKALMFKYASKNAVDYEPTSCSCTENKCIVD